MKERHAGLNDGVSLGHGLVEGIPRYRSAGVCSLDGRPCADGRLMPVISRSMAAYAAEGRCLMQSRDLSMKFFFVTFTMIASATRANDITRLCFAWMAPTVADRDPPHAAAAAPLQCRSVAVGVRRTTDIR